ncbi:MAG: DNA starvation/stationary phase protection protein [Elusimicrobia bacterium]|nr:DNA starvation/stationary phase protection protein [Elusimicrobiota bacterium]
MNTHTVVKPSVVAGIGLKDASRTAVLALLDLTLADEYLLYTKTRNFHWNVTGFHFAAMHKFFEEQYGQLDGFVDEVAERSRALGGRSLGSMREFLSKTRLSESLGDAKKKEETMIAELLADHESLTRSLRKDVDECARLGDQGTADFLTGLMESHEKMAWMLRSFLS